MNSNSQCLPQHEPVQGVLTVPQALSALELLPAHRGAHSGRITPVPKGTRLQVCGRGFNERTVQVRWEGRVGFVFLQDVEPVETPEFL
jgi:hypothetical protein